MCVKYKQYSTIISIFVFYNYKYDDKSENSLRQVSDQSMTFKNFRLPFLRFTGIRRRKGAFMFYKVKRVQSIYTDNAHFFTYTCKQ